MKKQWRNIQRRVQGATLLGVAALFVGAVVLFALDTGFEGQARRAVSASGSHLAELAKTRQQPAVLGVTAIQKYVQATEPRIYHPASPVAPAPQSSKAQVVYRIPTSEPVVFITIDDGVTPDRAGLELMRQKRAVATLFLNQVNIHKYKDYYRHWQDAGSSMQNHTLSHPHLPRMAPNQQHHEICTNAEWLKGVYGTRPHLLRPPYGEFNEATQQMAATCGNKYIVHWSAVVEKGQVAYSRTNTMRPGEILLLHFTPDLAKDLQAVFTAAEEQSLQIGKLEEWLP